MLDKAAAIQVLQVLGYDYLYNAIEGISLNFSFGNASAGEVTVHSMQVAQEIYL